MNYSSYQQVLLSSSNGSISYHSIHQMKTGNEFHRRRLAV